ncbi:transglutaminase TgpA family protein [Arthrobacter alpinus]|uniref:transglutaminase TgpA family protein n=1 Tax=Arthrobacter alpinus TaxID=656366 RepID=UPI000678F3AA|nr:DUF3488 and transglutaminase-like domain-containing protein [Arthrobacter alpinus]
MTTTLPTHGGHPSEHDADPTGGHGPARGIFANPRTGPAPWVLAVAVFGAVMGASLGLGGVLSDFGWWPRGAVVVAGTLLLPAVIRRYPALDPYAPLGALAGWFMSLTLVFFPTTSLLGFIPTAGTVRTALEMASEASTLIMTSNTPVPSAVPMFFLFCAGLGFVALLIDTVAITVAMPAASSLGILLVMLPPALTTTTGIGTVGFIGAGAGFLLVLGCCRWYAPDGKPRSTGVRFSSGTLSRAAALGAAVVLLMALIPAVIPGFTEGSFPQGSRLDKSGTGAGLDPMISLGDDLRSQSSQVNLTYLSNTEGPQYLRLTTLENFTGKSWQPSSQPASLQPGTSDLAPAAGPAPTVPTTQTLTEVTIEALSSEWLPAPLSAKNVENLTGQWRWNPSTQTIRGQYTSTQDQSYLVRSQMPVLSQATLTAASGDAAGVDPVFSALPADVPALVKDTALEVVGGETNAFAKALAIQDYLRSSAFSYNLNTPAAEGYDGSGMAVLEAFLTEKSGYCVHFSAAMAVMAREVGLASRIAVGYAPGTRTTQVGELDGQPLRGYEATGRDAHAWPEIYFEGLGWVPFEPTPSRGFIPEYAQEETSADPTAGATDAPVDVPTASGAVSATASATAGVDGANDAGPGAGPWLKTTGAIVLVLLVLAIPALARVYVRRRRLAQVRSGSGTPEVLAWRELLAAAADHGCPIDPALTPALQAERIAEFLGSSPRPGLELVLHAYEALAFGPAAAPSAGRDDLADAVEDLSARLHSRATPGGRIRAMLAPASLLHRP